MKFYADAVAYLARHYSGAYFQPYHHDIMLVAELFDVLPETLRKDVVFMRGRMNALREFSGQSFWLAEFTENRLSGRPVFGVRTVACGSLDTLRCIAEQKAHPYRMLRGHVLARDQRGHVSSIAIERELEAGITRLLPQQRIESWT